MSSGAHVIGKMAFDDLSPAEGGYQRWRRYGQSKLANLLFAGELHRRAGGRLLSASAHPGYAATHLQEGQGQAAFQLLMNLGNKVLAQSDSQGAWPQLYAGTMPDVLGDSYYGPHLMSLRGHPVPTWRTRGDQCELRIVDLAHARGQGQGDRAAAVGHQRGAHEGQLRPLTFASAHVDIARPRASGRKPGRVRRKGRLLTETALSCVLTSPCAW